MQTVRNLGSRRFRQLTSHSQLVAGEEGPSVICFARKRQVIQPKDLPTPVGRHG